MKELAKQLTEKAERSIILVKGDGKTIVALNGDSYDLASLLKSAFDSNKDFFKVVDASVKAYKDLQSFKEKDIDSQIKTVTEELAKITENLKKELN